MSCGSDTVHVCSISYPLICGSPSTYRRGQFQDQFAVVSEHNRFVSMCESNVMAFVPSENRLPFGFPVFKGMFIAL